MEEDEEVGQKGGVDVEDDGEMGGRVSVHGGSTLTLGSTAPVTNALPALPVTTTLPCEFSPVGDADARPSPLFLPTTMSILVDDHDVLLHPDYLLTSVSRLPISTSRLPSVRPPLPLLSPLCSPSFLSQEVDDSVCLFSLSSISYISYFSQGYEDHPDEDEDDNDNDDDDDTTYADEEYPSQRKPLKKAKKHRLPSAHVIRPRGTSPSSLPHIPTR